MKKVMCNQMQVIAEEDLNRIYGGAIEAGSAADKKKNQLQKLISGSRGCAAGAQNPTPKGKSSGRKNG